MSKRFLIGLGVFALLAAYGQAARAAPVVIDEFTDGSAELTTDTNDGIPDSVDQAGLSGVIGFGDRNLVAFQVAPPASTSSQDSELFIEAATGQAFLNSGSAITSRWTFDYGADSPFDVDVTGGGLNTHFGINFVSSDVAGTTVKVTAYETAGAGGTNFAVFSGAVPTGSSLLLLPFSSFLGVDMTHLARITYEFNGAEGVDHEIDLLVATTIPAPAALPAGLVLLAGLLLIRFKRRWL